MLPAASEKESPVPDSLAGDLLRAAVYKMTGLTLRSSNKLEVKVLRSGNRLLNHKAMMKHLSQALPSTVLLVQARHS